MARRRTMLGPAKPLAETGCRVRRSRVVLTPRCWRQVLRRCANPTGSGVPYSQTTVTTKPGRRGEREISRKTIACGNAGFFRWTCGDYARVFVFIHTRGCGCIGRPAFPTPSLFSGRTLHAQLGQIPPRECGGVSQTRHPCVTASPLSLEVRALRCSCTAGRVSKDERPGPSSFETHRSAMPLRMTEIV